MSLAKMYIPHNTKPANDLMVEVSVYNDAHAASFISTYYLSSYTPNETATPFQQLKNDILNKSNGLNVNWVGTALLFNSFPVLTMKGNIDWFKGVEFFRKYINSGGGADPVNQPDGFGLIDQNRKIRVEFENGQILILPA